jgi:hypothetical protein
MPNGAEVGDVQCPNKTFDGVLWIKGEDFGQNTNKSTVKYVISYVFLTKKSLFPTFFSEIKKIFYLQFKKEGVKKLRLKY